MRRILFIILLTIPFIGFGQGQIGYGCYGGSSSDVYKTTDGGITWNMVSTMNFNQLSFPSDNII